MRRISKYGEVRAKPSREEVLKWKETLPDGCKVGGKMLSLEEWWSASRAYISSFLWKGWVWEEEVMIFEATKTGRVTTTRGGPLLGAYVRCKWVARVSWHNSLFTRLQNPTKLLPHIQLILTPWESHKVLSYWPVCPTGFRKIF